MIMHKLGVLFSRFNIFHFIAYWTLLSYYIHPYLFILSYLNFFFIFIKKSFYKFLGLTEITHDVEAKLYIVPLSENISYNRTK